jgi:hypothetical protein
MAGIYESYSRARIGKLQELQALSEFRRQAQVKERETLDTNIARLGSVLGNFNARRQMNDDQYGTLVEEWQGMKWQRGDKDADLMPPDPWDVEWGNHITKFAEDAMLHPPKTPAEKAARISTLVEGSLAKFGEEKLASKLLGAWNNRQPPAPPVEATDSAKGNDAQATPAPPLPPATPPSLRDALTSKFGQMIPDPEAAEVTAASMDMMNFEIQGVIDGLAAKTITPEMLPTFVNSIARKFGVAPEIIAAQVKPMEQKTSALLSYWMSGQPSDRQTKAQNTLAGNPGGFSDPINAEYIRRISMHSGPVPKDPKELNTLLTGLADDARMAVEQRQGKAESDRDYAFRVKSQHESHVIDLANLGIAQKRLAMATNDGEKNEAARGLFSEVFGLDDETSAGLMEMTGDERMMMLKQLGVLSEKDDASVESLTKLLIGKIPAENFKDAKTRDQLIKDAADTAISLNQYLTTKQGANDLRNRSGY